jgi:Skp family chaperone for outer membrane proteins
MKMKKYLLFFVAIFGSFSFVMAQNANSQRSEKIKALKIAFITQKLQLTSAEAEKFWPVYNQYDNEIRQLRTNNRNGDVLEGEQKLLDTRKKYKPSFEKILGPQRLNDLYNAERDFRNVLIKTLKEQRQHK